MFRHYVRTGTDTYLIAPHFRKVVVALESLLQRYVCESTSRRILVVRFRLLLAENVDVGRVFVGFLRMSMIYREGR